MSSKRKMLFIFSFCILNIFLLIGFLVIRDETFLNTLKREERELLKLNMANSRYHRKIQSRGEYAIVEKAIKDYLDDYAVLLQNTLSVMDDSTLTTVLSYDNYCSDGPEFSKSLSYLNGKKKEFNENLEELFSKASNDSINKFISKRSNDSYYVGLYNDFMLSSEVKKQFLANQEVISNVQGKVNCAIDGSINVLNFLITNKDSWKVEDGEIKFLTQDLYNQYLNLVSKVNKNN